MLLKSLKSLLFTLPSFAFAIISKHQTPQDVPLLNSNSWIVYYSNTDRAEKFLPYSLIVFDSISHPNIEILKEENKTVLGYLSIGEVNPSNPYFTLMNNLHLLNEKNEFWEGNRMIDLRKKEFAALVIEEMIPNILFKHFNGVFLDTVDNGPYLEEKDPIKYKGMKTATINLIKAIKQNFPSIMIMMNRGFDLIEEIAPYIDAILGESVLTTYDFKTKTYIKKRDEYQITMLKRAKELNPNLTTYSLDYWYPDDKATINALYAEEESLGFIPYVSTIELNQIVQRPSIQ